VFRVTLVDGSLSGEQRLFACHNVMDCTFLTDVDLLANVDVREFVLQ
jgi:hypothetical protein